MKIRTADIFETKILDIINVSGTTSGVSYNPTFLYKGLKRN